MGLSERCGGVPSRCSGRISGWQSGTWPCDIPRRCDCGFEARIGFFLPCSIDCGRAVCRRSRSSNLRPSCVGLGVVFRAFRRWKSRGRPGRPRAPNDIRDLLCEVSLANPLWGAPRIHGELSKVGIVVAQSTVAKFMVKHGCPPSNLGRRSSETTPMALPRSISSWSSRPPFDCCSTSSSCTMTGAGWFTSLSPLARRRTGSRAEFRRPFLGIRPRIPGSGPRWRLRTGLQAMPWSHGH